MLEGSRLQRLEELSRQRLEVLIHKDSTPRMKHIHLRESELLIDHQFAKTPETGGELALTDQRLIFAPWRFTALRDMLAAGFWPVTPEASLPPEAQRLMQLAGTVMLPLAEITAASPGRKAALHRPPGLRVTTSVSTVEFGILVGPWKRNRAPSNTRARDTFVAAVNAALSASS
jgi:hypothetical protein